MQDSILDKVIYSQKSAATVGFNPQEILNTLLKNLKEREVDVLTLRYGFKDNKKRTLEEIGNKFNVTRERVRQIESSGLKKIKNLTELDEHLKSLEIIINQILEDHGGIMNELSLIKKVLIIPGETNSNFAATHFILSHLIKDRLHYLEPTDEFHASWKLPTISLETIKNILQIFIKTIEKIQEPLTAQKIAEQTQIEQLPPDWQTNLDEQIIHSFLETSKQVGTNPFKEWGLKNWNSVSLKRMSDKIFLILKKEDSPLHFTEIANKINEIGFDNKKANPATIHNELILDKKYVLVGRGIYALTDWGYKPGVVADVIEDILKEAGTSLTREEIIEKVLAKRMVKQSTIILALMNKDRFKRTSSGKYELASK